MSFNKSLDLWQFVGNLGNYSQILSNKQMVLFLLLVHPVEIHSARADSAVSNVFPRLLRVFFVWCCTLTDKEVGHFIPLNKGRVIFSQNLSQILSIQGISIVNCTNVCYTSVSRIEHIMFTYVIIKLVISSHLSMECFAKYMYIEMLI